MARLRSRLTDTGRPTALFLDIDGTLAGFQADPAEVRIAPEVRQAIGALREGMDQALALVTGRDLPEADVLVGVGGIDIAACHGAVVRRLGAIMRTPAPWPAGLAEQLGQFAARHAGVRLEAKSASLALHWREQPLAAPAVARALDAMVADSHGALRMQKGACVTEIMPSGASKGAAIAGFMAEAPYLGRRPVFIGDDLTDESGFDVVNRLGGISVKVGRGPTAATCRIASPRGVGLLLRAMALARSRSD